MAVELKKVTAIVRSEVLGTVKTKLKDIGVPDIVVDYVSGYQNPQQVFEMPELITHARIEVLMEASGVERVVKCISESAYVGSYDDGVISVLPIDAIYKINNKGRSDCD